MYYNNIKLASTYFDPTCINSFIVVNKLLIVEAVLHFV